MEGLLLPVLLVLFVALMFNSQRKRQRQFSQMQSSLQVGQEIVTTAGLHARILELDDEVAVLETSPGQTVRWDRRGIARVVAEAGTSDSTEDLDELEDDELDEADVGGLAGPTDDSGVDLNKSTPSTDEK